MTMRGLVCAAIATLLAGCGSVGAETRSGEPPGNPPQVVEAGPGGAVMAPAAAADVSTTKQPPYGPVQVAPATTNAPPTTIGGDPCSTAGASLNKHGQL